MSDEVPGTGSSSAGDPGQAGRDDASGKRGKASGERAPDFSEGGEGSNDRDLGAAEHDERLAADAAGNDGVHGAYAEETPEQLLGEVAAVRRKTRLARHAYWFPLVLFGLLTCASVPFYIRRRPTPSEIYASRHSGLPFLQSGYLVGLRPLIGGGGNAYYWLAAIIAGLAATAVWYRLSGDRAGLRTASRAFVITGLVLLFLALLIPVLATRAGVGPLTILMPRELLARGTFPFVLIGIGLCVLAWAERSVALTVIAAGYLALALVASLYDIQNVFYDLGWNLSPTAAGLPNVVLPALVLLLSGAGAWVVQRRSRPRPSGPATPGPVSEVS